MWLPLLGSALFLVALMLFLATSSDDEVKAEAEPTDSAQAVDDGEEADDDHAGHDHDKPKPRGAAAPRNRDDDGADSPARGDRQAKPTRKLDALRAQPPRGQGKMVPAPSPSIRVRRID
jgi:hypothetical protein